MSVVPSAEPDEGEPKESAGAPIGPDERKAAEVPSPHICSTCGYYINGGHVLCLMPGCDGFAKGALQCRFCLRPVAPIDTCADSLCLGRGFASPPDWNDPAAVERRTTRKERLLGDR